MPIDFFLRHLADDQKNKAVGIIFSGTGTDGTLGVRTLKEKMGLTMTQDPSTSTYKSMPESAISTGMVDYSAPASELPAKLLEYSKHFLTKGKVVPELEKGSNEALGKIIALVRSNTGNDFSSYKMNTILRRIDRRMAVHQIGGINQYLRYLQENPQEINLLFKELLIGVTSFFRDPEAFEALKAEAIPRLLKSSNVKSNLRAWVAGCSTGEEAYSLAIIVLECLDEMGLMGQFQVQIYATDIDKDSIEKARRGVYLANIAQDVSEERLQRFFVNDEDRYRVKKEVRDLIVFAQQNVISDPPFTKLDLLSCRNLLIYLSTELQKKLLSLFHYSLNPGGVLFLGSSETIGSSTDLFSPLDSRWRIFLRRETSIARGAIQLPPPKQPEEAKTPGAWKTRKALDTVTYSAEKVILERIAPPVVLINENGDLLYFTRPTGKYLEPPVGKANMNIYAMAREGLRLDLGIAIRKALSDKKRQSVRGIKVRTNDHYQTINLTVDPLNDPESLRSLLMIIFEDAEEVPRKAEVEPTDSSPSTSRLADINRVLERELMLSKQRLQSVIEDAESTQEDLKSANEELQSTNEELQSVNEELNTSREEMQSLNEELTSANNDLANLLNSIHLPALFLDSKLHIRRFTTQMTQIANLRDADIGRPIADIAFNLQGTDIIEMSRKVIHNLVPREDQVQSKDGRWYVMKVMPDRTLDDLIDGVVISFSEITEIKKLEDSLQKTVFELKDRTSFAEGVIETVREPLIVLDANLRIVSANKSFYEKFNTKPEDTIGEYLYDLGNKQWDIAALRMLLEDVLSRNSVVEDFAVEHDFPKIGIKKMLLNARKMAQNDKNHWILLAMEDVTDRKKV